MAVMAFGRAEFAAETAVLSPKVAPTSQQRGGREPQGRRRSIDDVPGAFANHLAHGDAIVWTEPEPGGEVRIGLPARHIEANFADHGLRHPDINAVDSRQVDSVDAVELLTQIELWRVAARLPASC
jgi:hypothetical protein